MTNPILKPDTTGERVVGNNPHRNRWEKGWDGAR
jgi:hypothetical protein